MTGGPEGDTLASRLQTVEIGENDAGEIITSCVIAEGDAPTTAARPNGSRKPPSPLAQKFHAALLDALCTAAAKPRHQSANRPSVTSEEWHRELVRLGLIDDAKKDSVRSLVSKCRRELIAANWIACNGGIVWIIK